MQASFRADSGGPAGFRRAGLKRCFLLAQNSVVTRFALRSAQVEWAKCTVRAIPNSDEMLRLKFFLQLSRLIKIG
jgi:hypothetical protein